MSKSERPVVHTEPGRVRGTAEGDVVAFRGVPYAASPVGDLRFAAPEPHPAWTGVREADRPGPSVPQVPSRLDAVMGPRRPDWDEHGCLTVNVWAPEGRTDLPVLLWLHGGGFTSGSAGWDWYDGAALAAAGEVVVVTANYRLGPLGYLYLPDLGVENLGVQDQAAALDWVRRNIEAFGGNPADITVGGQSAGAFSALYLALSPVTGPHVKRVLTQSGPFGLVPQDPEVAAARARDYLGILGAHSMRELRAVPAGQLLDASQRLSRKLSRPGPVAPPLYPVLGGPGIALPWQQALAEGRLDGKPLLLGTTKDEMTAFFAYDPQIQALSAEQARAIVAEQAADGAERFDQAAARRPQATPSEVLTEVETGIVFRDKALALAGHHATAGNATYVYQFDYTPPGDPAHLGAAHCVELPFFFNNFDAYPDSAMLGEPTAATRALGDAFSRAAATFIATGEPEDWPPHEPANPATIRHFG